MPKKSKIISDEDFIALFRVLGASGVAKRLRMNRRAVQRRRQNMEILYHMPIDPPTGIDKRRPLRPVELPHRLHCDIQDGVVLVGSDAHIWPGPETPAMRAFIQFCKSVDGEKPKVIVLNGDVLDFPQISRHPPIGWESLPTVADEMEAAKEVLHQIEKATFKARKVWTLGNHDARFETRLASLAPEYAQIHGVHLRDHFPNWEPCWSTWINQDTVIKHRFKGGIHAPHNNAMWAGRTMVTGHLHSAKVTPVTDYNGTRYGVDTGCLAKVDSRQFVDYTEDNPKNWISAFCVLSYVKGKLLWPELVSVVDEETVQFRGKLIKV